VPEAVEQLEELRADLASGAWQMRHNDLLTRAELDIGYRLVVAYLPGARTA
jgi:hypothetical protein